MGRLPIAPVSSPCPGDAATTCEWESSSRVMPSHSGRWWASRIQVELVAAEERLHWYCCSGSPVSNHGAS
eukprot:6034338-Pyramimonas_sp.AAC.1